MFPDRGEGIVMEPGSLAVDRIAFLAGVHLEPDDGAFPSVCFRDGRVEDPPGGPPDIGAGSVSLDERNDWMVGDNECPLMGRDGATFSRRREPLVGGHR